jgi:hypothetical protein
MCQSCCENAEEIFLRKRIARPRFIKASYAGAKLASPGVNCLRTGDQIPRRLVIRVLFMKP